MKKFLLLFLCFCLVVTSQSVLAHKRGYHDRHYHKNIKNFAAMMHKKHGFSTKKVRALLKAAEKKQSILDAIQRPAEAKPWHEYRALFLTDERIQLGKEFYTRNMEHLRAAEEKYGVPPQVILGIIGVETRYGKRKGGYRILDALYTLGFHYPRRGKFFRSELAHFLVLCRDQGMDPLKVTGSYAGAMGWPQFMPSSYLTYAVDFDGDKKKDLIENEVDAIGSVANYLSRHGWQKGETVVVQAQIEGSKYKKVLKWGIKPKKKIAQLKQYGIQPESKVDENKSAALFDLETENGTIYRLGLKNFYVITRYNRSTLYASAVYELGNEVMKAVDSPKTAQSESKTESP